MSYRILSLDGGGTWALIEVTALIALYGENAPDRTVLQDFNMVAANSRWKHRRWRIACRQEA
ncbi:MAG TPA: hypothetical protein VKZ53_21820 [Candidatus Angelobacter sp.]|nr:hypothetical protein [Candidatus Angelobacter sp.]